MGKRAHDHRAIPLCRQHHQDIELRHGPFAGWTREQVRRFEDEQADLARATYLALEASTFPF